MSEKEEDQSLMLQTPTFLILSNSNQQNVCLYFSKSHLKESLFQLQLFCRKPSTCEGKDMWDSFLFRDKLIKELKICVGLVQIGVLVCIKFMKH